MPNTRLSLIERTMNGHGELMPSVRSLVVFAVIAFCICSCVLADCRRIRNDKIVTPYNALQEIIIILPSEISICDVIKLNRQMPVCKACRRVISSR